MLLIIAGLVALSFPQTKPGVDPLAKNVLVVMNQNSPESEEIAQYYLQKRQIPAANLFKVNVPNAEDIPRAECRRLIEEPIREFVATRGKNIDYVVMTKGVPFRLSDTGYSVDAQVVGVMSNIPAIGKLDEPTINRSRNPYFGTKAAHTRKLHDLLLVTRLDGYTVADAKRLVDLSTSATKTTGPFLLDESSNMTGGDYGELQKLFTPAAVKLKAKKLNVIHDQARAFAAPSEKLMGYVSWGSKDNAFRPEIYRKLQFRPGAIAETFVSTSARTFKPVTGGQSLIGDLIRQGVTGVKGYCSEPYLFAMANPEVLLDRYTDGFNLAESFYMASPILKWKDIVIGDPLCRPYRK